MRSGSVEVVYIGIEDALELPLMQDQQVIEALTPDTAEEALTDSIGTRGVIGDFEYLDTTCLRHPSEGHPKLAIMITDKVLRTRCAGYMSHLPKKERV